MHLQTIPLGFPLLLTFVWQKNAHTSHFLKRHPEHLWLLSFRLQKMSGPPAKNPETGNVLLIGALELDFCLQYHIRNVDQYQAGCEMSKDCQNCSCLERISSVCGGTWRREGRASSVTLSHCWLQQFKHTTYNGNHMPIYLLQLLNPIERLCQESLEV